MITSPKWWEPVDGWWIRQGHRSRAVTMAARELDSIIDGIEANKGAIMVKRVERERHAGEMKWGNTHRGWAIYIGFRQAAAAA